MEDYNETEPESRESKINSAGIINISLNNLWLDFFRHYRQGQYRSAHSDLDCIWTILGGEEGIEGSEDEEGYLKIETELAKSGELVDSLEIKGFGSKLTHEQIVKFNNQKLTLKREALYLRRLQNSQGMGKAYADFSDEEAE